MKHVMKPAVPVALACWLAAIMALASEPAGPHLSIRLEKPVPIPDNSGDTWVAAWAEDDNLYSPSNDTRGFHKAGSSNIAFNRLTGDDPLKLTGTTVNTLAEYGKLAEEGADGRNWKSSGCTIIDGVLYMVVARHTYGEKSGDPHRRQLAADASIVKSADLGKTWARSVKENHESPMFKGRRFATPYFVQYGRGGRGGPDGSGRFVYAISNNGFWDNGDDMILGRVARSRIGDLKASDWEFFAGGDGAEDSAWSRDMGRSALLLKDPGKLGMTGAVHVPASGRYLMIGWHYPAGGGVMPGASSETIWEVYEAPRPWGPWSRIGTHRFAPQGYYSPQIVPKFTSADGKRLFAFTAGDWNDPDVYRLTVVPIVVEPASAPAAPSPANDPAPR